MWIRGNPSRAPHNAGPAANTDRSRVAAAHTGSIGAHITVWDLSRGFILGGEAGLDD